MISTENRYVDTPIKGYDTTVPGNYVVLAISDSGMGIPQDKLAKIFEPFYTSKIMGRSGTGLGMTVVWGTVKDHEGYLDVKSAPDNGTTITVFLPALIENWSIDPHNVKSMTAGAETGRRGNNSAGR